MTRRARITLAVACLAAGCGDAASLVGGAVTSSTDAGRAPADSASDIPTARDVADAHDVPGLADATLDATDVPAPLDVLTDVGALDGGPRDAGPRCAPLVIAPATLRIATEAGARFATMGGSGSGALFTLARGAVTGGATVGVGGGVVGGTRAASFEVTATDLPCGLSATARVEVVGPFTVAPLDVVVAPGRSLRFEAQGNLGAPRWDLLAGPDRGDARVAVDGTFTAGTVVGAYLVRGTDTGSGREIQARVRVAIGDPFGAAQAVVAVPAGRRVELGWRGGGGAVDASIVGDARGARLVREGEAWIFDATAATRGAVTVRGVQRFTREEAAVGVSVGDELAAPPIPRGPQNLFGDVAFGDLDGDGRDELIVGQANRSRTGIETGGVLVYNGRDDGRWSATPDAVIEGARDLDHFGATVLPTDVDGDAITDLVVASPDQDLGRDGRGAVSVFLGSRRGLVQPPERVFVGDAANDRFGTAVLVQDLDGDGAVDIVMSAPNSNNTFAAGACRANGRVYVFRGARGLRGVFDPVPAQVLDVRDRLTDTDGVPDCRAGIDAGRSLALMDIDLDGRQDLIVGAPLAAYGPAGAPAAFGSVLVFRGTARGAFDAIASWSIHLDPAHRPANARFGFGLDVVALDATRRTLVVRAPFFAQNLAGAATTQAGGFWVFPAGSLGPAPEPGTLRVVLSSRAATRWTGAANDGAARSALVTDLDGDGGAEYLVGGAGDGAPNGALFRFPLNALAGTATPVPATTTRGEAGEFLGARLAVARSRGGPAALAVWAAYRNTAEGYAGGALAIIDAAVGATDWSARWTARRELPMPVLAAGDRAGTGVAVGAMRDSVGGDVAIGATGAHSPAIPMVAMTPARAAGFRSRVGVVDVFPRDVATSAARQWQDRAGIQLGAAVAVLDFDGDGRADLAVGDPGAASGGSDWVTQRLIANTATDPCLLRNGTTIPTASVGGRGVVRVYLSQPDGSLAERFWLIPRETVAAGGTARRLGFGASLANAGDVNGDGLDDLIVGRAGGATTNGAEVVLGRAPDAMGRVLAHCGDPSSAPWWDARADGTVAGVAVARLGDLDGDGCGEVATSISGNTGGSARAGVALQFGFGPRCGTRVAPDEVVLVADGRALRDNAIGDIAARANDLNDLPGASTGMGLVIAGGADLTGDRVPDLAFRDAALAFRDTQGPAVEVISGAYIASLCPAGRCPDGRRDSFFVDGAYRVLGLRELTAPTRLILPAPTATTARFGSCIALADVNADGVAELLVGAPDLPSDGTFAGALLGWRGALTQDVLVDAPWLRAVGDLTELGSFGQSCAAQPIAARDGGGAWLVVGAPTSNHRGALTGAAYRWRLR